MTPPRGHDPVREFLREHGGMVLSVAAISLCMFVAWLMQQERGGRRSAAPMSMSDAARPSGSGASYRPSGPSSLDFAPKWGRMPLSPEQAPPAPPPTPEQEAGPEPEPPVPPIPDMPLPELPNLAEVAKMAKKAAGDGGAASPTRVMTAVPTFEKREDAERAAVAELGAASPAPAGSVEAKKARTMNAILRAGQDGSLQRFGLDKDSLYRLEKLGTELSQYIQPDGTFKINEKDARLLNEQLGLGRGKDDKMPSASSIGH